MIAVRRQFARRAPSSYTFPGFLLFRAREREGEREGGTRKEDESRKGEREGAGGKKRYEHTRASGKGRGAERERETGGRRGGRVG